MKNPSRKKVGMRMEKTTKMARFDEPIRETMFVTTDENGRHKCSSSSSA